MMLDLCSHNIDGYVGTLLANYCGSNNHSNGGCTQQNIFKFLQLLSKYFQMLSNAFRCLQMLSSVHANVPSEYFQ